MSGISTSIGITDRVSGSLNRITAALYNTTSAFERVDQVSETTFNTAGVQAMAQEMYSYEQRIQQLEADLVDANERLGDMEAQTNKVARSGNMLRGIFGMVAGTISAISVQKVVDASDELVSTTARLNNMNDGLQTTDQLVQMVYQSAQDARGSFSGMADVVARFGNNAGDAFESTEEVVRFANLVQKQMTIAGAGTNEAQNAMLQLSQALGSGTLRGDELNSIFEQAPNLIQSIADYLDVPIGKIRGMASEGQLSADIVKAAIFASADEINEKFDEMPMTWGQIWQSMQNTALMAFQPILKKINEVANSERSQDIVTGVTNAMQTVANVTAYIFELVGNVAGFVYDNWSVIEPIIWGIVAALAIYAAVMVITNTLNAISAGITATKAAADAMAAGATFWATAAQHGFNAALAACPITWIVVLIIALIAVIIALANWIAKTTGVAETGFGVIAGVVAVVAAFIGNIIVGLANFIVGIGASLYNLIATFANFFANVFNDPVGAIVHLFSGLFDFILSVVESAAGMIDTLLGTDMSGAISSFRNNMSAAIDSIVGEQKVVMETVNPSDYMLEGFDYGDAWNSGAEWGDGAAEKLNNLTASLNTSDIDSAYTGTDTGSVADNLSKIAGDTSDIKDSVDISDENLAYLRDIAERDTINRFTTAEIKIDMQNNNTINSNMDIDGFVDQVTIGIAEAIEQGAEGVHE